MLELFFIKTSIQVLSLNDLLKILMKSSIQLSFQSTKCKKKLEQKLEAVIELKFQINFEKQNKSLTLLSSHPAAAPNETIPTWIFCPLEPVIVSGPPESLKRDFYLIFLIFRTDFNHTLNKHFLD